QIFIAFVIAIILGIIFGESIAVLEPLGDLFPRLIKFIIAPLVRATLVVGVASIGDPKTLGRIGSKTIIYYLLTTGVAIAIRLAVEFVISPGEGLDLNVANSEVVEINESEGKVQTLVVIEVEITLYDLSECAILLIIFFVE